jgi:flagellar assembly protein FliH
MGKVIKGSIESGTRYTLAVPAFVVHGPSSSGDAASFDEAEPLDVMAEPEPPPEPPIDLDAIRTQAQEIIDAASHEAKAIVDEAHARAEAVLADATSNAAAVAETTRRQAESEGYARGLADASAAMSDMLAGMRDLVESVRTERTALLTAAEPELVRLAVGIAERVLHQQIALDAGVVVEMARAAITRIVDREKITVRVNPADVERMREHRDELLALGDVKTMRVIEDQRVDRGGVVLETDAGSVDAKISTQLAEVRKILHIVDDVVVQPIAAAPDASDSTPLAARAS